MSKQDYELIASSFKAALGASGARYGRTHVEAMQMDLAVDIVRELNLALRQDNPRFDADRFSRACGLVPADFSSRWSRGSKTS